MPNPATSSPAVMQAIQRRQGPQPALGQVSNQARMANQVPQPANPSSLNKASAPAGEPPKLSKFEPQNRKDLITLALVEALKSEDKLDKEKMKMATQPQPEPAQSSVAPAPQAPQGAPMGGGSPFSMSPGFSQPMPVNQMQGNYAGGMGNYGGMNNYGK